MGATTDRLPLISVHSYKGGVGKTTITALLGLALCQDRKVCLVDLDLVAPGLHHILAVQDLDRPILDYLVANPEQPSATATARQVCQAVSPGLPGATGLKMHLIHGRPNWDSARGIQSYLLADARAGLVQARLEVLLREARRECGIDVFVLDTPPSLFGMSAAVRALVGRHGGAIVHISTPTMQDLAGSWEMLDVLERVASQQGVPDPATEAFVLNRCTSDPQERGVPAKVRNAIMTALGLPRTDRAQAAVVDERLKHYKVGLLFETDACQRMSLVGAVRPALSDVLDQRIEQVARWLIDAVERGHQDVR